MRRNFTRYLLLCSLLLSIGSCNDDEVVNPPKATLSVDKTAGLVGDTEFTFTVNEVNANGIALLTYGGDSGDAGIRITSFSNGTAVVKVKYSKPGTFNAVVRTNNHSGDGESVKNVDSDPVQIVITSDDKSIAEFSFDESTATEIDQDAKTITVTVPYGTDVTALKANFSASAFSTVSVGGTEQASGETANNFSVPVNYTVTADDGTSAVYAVSVVVTPAETDDTIKSAAAKATSTNADDRAMWVSVDNAARTLVVYDTFQTASTQFDSVRVGYALNGAFAILKYGGKVLPQDSLLNLADATAETFVVYPQDSVVSGTATYGVYATDAPKLKLSFSELNPDPIGIGKPTDFTYDIKVLQGTDVEAISTTATIDTPVGVTVTQIKVVDGPTLVAGVPADVDYTLPAKIELTVLDTRLGGAGITYKVVYNVNVSVVE
ncbi:MAG: hypothetical protein WA874_22165 [Chryseosolibacter sp.]